MKLDSSTLVHFRKRISLEMLNEINEKITNTSKNKNNAKKEEKKDEDDTDNDNKIENKDKLIIDATCVPEDIKYPTDLNLLNESRENIRYSTI